VSCGATALSTISNRTWSLPAAEILISAHRELEKLTLLGSQAVVKEPVSQVYGQLIHEGKQLDPACRDIEALLASSQARVTGKVRVQLRPGSLFVLGVTSPHSLMAVSRGKYGEAAGEWTPADAYGFSKIMALPGMFHTRAGGQ
jgi:argininosuccinate synthase